MSSFRPMTKPEMRDILSELGWTQNELARRLTLRSSTVSQWPEEKIPGPAEAYLRLKLMSHRSVPL